MECLYTTCYYTHVSKHQKTAVIIGAGPAGLTAAYELLARTDIRPIVLEENPRYVGGIAKTANYKGNRIDIGGHRFFSKSDRVMHWWLDLFPPEINAAGKVTYRGKETSVEEGSADPAKTDRVMLVRKRLSRMHYNGKFFDYPITLTWDTLRKLGFLKLLRIGFTYVGRRLWPRKPEKSLEDFYINRFGDELYKTFFESYTQKVWGVPCSQLSAEWGAQRVKGLSLTKVVLNALQKPFRRQSISQKKTETSLIEWFLYPKLGPGALWEEVARLVIERGGEVRMGQKVVRLSTKGQTVTGVTAIEQNGKEHTYQADYVFSTMPIKDLAEALPHAQDNEAFALTQQLPYRDFVTVGLLLKKEGPLAEAQDNWIYVHDRQVELGRIQIFNNWSPYLVADPEHTVWIGMEYFCYEGDALWNMPDAEFIQKAARELELLGLASPGQVLDGCVLRERKTYPSYTGVYGRFDEIRRYLDQYENLYPLCRNGMHRYNNQDHSMLTAMVAVDNIAAGRSDKSNLWAINTEEDYHESKN